MHIIKRRRQVAAFLQGLDQSDFRDLLTFLSRDGVAALQRLVAQRASRDPLFRDLLDDAGCDLVSYRAHQDSASDDFLGVD